MNDVERNIDRLLNLLVSTPTLADQLIDHFDATLHAVDVEISREETQTFLKGSALSATSSHFTTAVVESYSCTLPGDTLGLPTILGTLLTPN